LKEKLRGDPSDVPEPGPKIPGIKRFVKEMNRLAAKMNLKNTNFNNPHGLSDKANHSTAYELGRLCCHCMRSS